MKKALQTKPISPEQIAKSIAHHQVKTNIGAHEIFLGQVRADVINEKKITAIDYTAYEEMAENEINIIRENAFKKFNLTCMHIYHSIGKVKIGEICLFVFTSSAHRKDAQNACRFIVEKIKENVPIFGKEIFENGDFVWKENK